jgi:glycosidase
MTSRQSPLPDRWWEHASGVIRFMPKRNGKTICDVIRRLDEVQDWGFDAVELFAPYHGGLEYAGLDVMDYYRVDPAIGNVEDFEELVRSCHDRGLAIIVFVNLGYGAMEYPVFLKACDDVRAGVDSPEVHWFLWSDTGTEELSKSGVPYFRNDLHGHWHYSERAHKYYWVKWQGQKGDVELPQFYFGDPTWPQACKRVVEFWMETGIDGMIIDAVNWYIDCTWEINNQAMTDVIRRYPNQYIQPEGAGGFGDDPVPWITKGHYNSVQDYGLAIWWTDHDVIGKAIASGDPSEIEVALQAYRDRVVAAGGVTYMHPSRQERTGHAQELLAQATLATVGELFQGAEWILDLDHPEEYRLRLKNLLRALQAYPALQAAGDRQQLSTNDDHRYYAFLRTSVDGKQQALVVLNFQSEAQDIVVRIDGPLRLEPIVTLGQPQPAVDARHVRVTLPAYGYGIYTSTPFG